jgi:hypothetical protein
MLCAHNGPDQVYTPRYADAIGRIGDIAGKRPKLVPRDGRQQIRRVYRLAVRYNSPVWPFAETAHRPKVRCACLEKESADPLTK